ncbi:MAG: Gfo/Idh/MocA family oxidoreductase [Bryobacteraceae bacterium]
MDSRRHFLGKVASGLAGTLASVPARALGANDRIRVGIAGAGDRGLELIHQIRMCPGAEVGAIADVYNRRLEKAASFIPSATLATDYRAMLDDASLDAIVIATPTHLHAEQFCAAIEAGKHIYLEKTLALNIAQANRMRTAFEASGGKLTVQVGHQSCSFGQLDDVRQFLAQPARMGRVSAIHMRNFRNTPHGKPQWARPALLTADLHPRNIAWEAFEATDAKRAFDANRFVHWRYYWDYSGGGVNEHMSQQLVFWHKALRLEIPESATMTGGLYVWDDGRETPDTMDISFAQPEKMLITWSSGFGNNQLGVSEDVLGSAGTISRSNQVRYIPQKINNPAGTEMTGRATHAPHVHMQNFFDSIRTSREPNCPFELGYRVSVACSMAVESYRQSRTVRWNAASREIV